MTSLGRAARRGAVSVLVATFALAGLWTTGAGAAILRDAGQVDEAGPRDAVVRCAGRWAPIQAKVSGFVVGNCRGGSPVRVSAVDICAPGCVRGAETEGRAWAAFSPPAGGRYRACGWLNVKNRSQPAAAADRVPRSRCGELDGPDHALLQSYVKRDTGRSVGGAPAPRTSTYRGLYLWAGRFHSGRHRGREGGAITYRPRLGRGRTCRAYANVDPTRPGGRVSRRERMWLVRDRSEHLQIRYIARYRAADERGRLRWWVNAHSTAPEDRDQPWGFVSAECLFQHDRRQGRDHAAPRDVPPLIQRVVRPAGSTQRARCDFGPTAFHRIVATHGMGCARAKTILRRLRGPHDLAPVSCTKPQRVMGWHLRNLVRDPSLGVTRYSRAGKSFDFQRHQFPGNIWCPAPH